MVDLLILENHAARRPFDWSGAVGRTRIEIGPDRVNVAPEGFGSFRSPFVTLRTTPQAPGRFEAPHGAGRPVGSVVEDETVSARTGRPRRSRGCAAAGG